VGGSTRGRVRIPSRIIFHSLRLTPATALAAKIPRKKVTPMEREAVFMEIRIGEISTLKRP
jgi:hypothetical protein